MPVHKDNYGRVNLRIDRPKGPVKRMEWRMRRRGPNGKDY